MVGATQENPKKKRMEWLMLIVKLDGNQWSSLDWTWTGLSLNNIFCPLRSLGSWVSCDAGPCLAMQGPCCAKLNNWMFMSNSARLRSDQ